MKPTNIRATTAARSTVRVTLTVVVDADAWNAEYGEEETRAEIHEAVRMMALDGTHEATRHLRNAGVIFAVDRADWPVAR